MENTKDSEARVPELEAMLKEYELLHKVSQKLSEKKDLPILLEEIMESSKTIMKAEASSLLLYNHEKNKLCFDVVTGDKKSEIDKIEINMGDGIAGWVAEKKQSILIEDCYSDNRFDSSMDLKTNFKTKSMICVPMLRNEKLIGVMQVLNRLGNEVFTEFNMTLFETLASQCAIAIENAQLVVEQIKNETIASELKMAHGIQMNLLPKSLPIYDDISISAKLIPAREVGGDYYNIVKLNEEFSLFAIADVSGKGVPAALLVSVIYSSLITQINQSAERIELKLLVETLNKVLIEATTNDRFVTAWIGIYEHSTKKLHSINAGHNYPYLFRDGLEQPMELTKGGIMLGSLDFPFEEEIEILKQNDLVILYTDGVTEAWNNLEEEYGEERLIQLVKTNKSLEPTQLIAKLMQDIKNHVGEAEPSDDITCVVLKVK